VFVLYNTILYYTILYYRIAAARFLRSKNNGIPVLSSEHEVAELAKSYPNLIEERKYTAGTLGPMYTEEGDDVIDDKDIPYSFISPLAALQLSLNTTRAKSNATLGVQLGTDGLAIGVVQQGDHGGDYMQYCQVMLTEEGSGQTNYSSLGNVQCKKDTYDILRKTHIPLIDEEIGKMNKLFALVIEWTDTEGNNSFDYKLVPKDHCEDTSLPIDRIVQRKGQKLHISLKQQLRGTESYHTAEFEREDIPAIALCSLKYLPIINYLCSDLAYIMMLYGRQNHASCKCIYCDFNPKHIGEGLCSG
jgi:hypothetical protein